MKPKDAQKKTVDSIFSSKNLAASEALIVLCKGKGNSDWNNSAPHGAGRIMNRNQVKKK